MTGVSPKPLSLQRVISVSQTGKPVNRQYYGECKFPFGVRRSRTRYDKLILGVFFFLLLFFLSTDLLSYFSITFKSLFVWLLDVMGGLVLDLLIGCVFLYCCCLVL